MCAWGTITGGCACHLGPDTKTGGGWGVGGLTNAFCLQDCMGMLSLTMNMWMGHGCITKVRQLVRGHTPSTPLVLLLVL